MTNPGEMWDRRFAEHPWPTDPDPYLVQLADPLTPGRGLDLGAGPGRNSLWLAAKGWDMTLVDASTVALAQAVAAAQRLGVAIATVHAELSTWQSEQADFDLVIVANVHPGPDQLAALLSESVRALRLGGHLYVVGHHVANLGRHGPPDPDRLLTADRLRAALPAGVSLEVLDTRDRTADHGEHDAQESDTVVLAWATRTAVAGVEHPTTTS